MYEIELKAHVYDKPNTIKKINTFATYLGDCHKKDTYWINQTTNQQIRIRCILYKENRESKTYIVTYKQKQIKNSEDGSTYEVNKEHEFTINNPNSLEEFLKDAGFAILRKKEKITSQWEYQNTLLELCTVPPLGDFLELEIIAKDNTESTVTKAKEELLNILTKCEIEKKHIEPKYYNQMIQEYIELN